ncbi:CDP-glycerol glycerophosphotransferase (TagB/SpsB family) [Paenibacillus forsythiae]|uniref:CDP-glycerol glycerophosphotransferase (TagB/SpsB family) n=1 Tax=Paenibacillus forsythiae TaxID=365616 RepID=A0ABU3HFP7_9BACL|nr:CDP-glycerol glycerophosphotransferase family protein [Paenibacillus forsythiae]MDT3428867.1 CDP-glycerol glycerophosphotransferase (TagB/SpsB family) [Paenibacillus forsythiae]
MLNQKLANKVNESSPPLSREFQLIQSLQQKGQLKAASEISNLLEQIQENYQKIHGYKNWINKYRQMHESRLSKLLLRMHKKVKGGVSLIGGLLYKSVVVSLSAIVRFHSKGDIWLIGERVDQAEDNGFEFFKYCREHYPHRRIFYVIDPNSNDILKINHYGNIIYHSTFKHHVYVLAAEKYISAWTFKESLLPRNFNKLFGSSDRLRKKKNICLQHGVIIHNISPYMHKDIYNIDYLLCSSEKEKEIIKSTLGYSDEEILVTGLARFDNLVNANPKRQILVMPTWRRYLANKSRELFESSTFFETYRQLLTNQRLIKLLDQFSYELVFYLHHNFQKYSSSFKLDSERITVVDSRLTSAASLIQSSAILITDYSSVASDFVYMNRPVLFYQFDSYHNHHSPIEEIEYSDLGNVAETEEDLFRQLEQWFTTRVEDDQLEERRALLFNNVDANNCSRIFASVDKI